MNNGQLYLAWLRTYAPAVYAAALRKATGQTRTLGGLTDDLVGTALAPDLRHSFLGDDMLDEITVTANYMPEPFSPDDFSFDAGTPSFDPGMIDTPDFNVPIDNTPAPAPKAAPLKVTPAPSSSGSIFGSILTAATTIGVGLLGASTQNKLISLNTTRAQQGLPPVDASGRVVTPAKLSTTSPSLLAFEKAITGGGSMMLPILGVLGIGAFFLLRKRS